MGKKKIKSIHAHIFRIKQRNEYVNGTEQSRDFAVAVGGDGMGAGERTSMWWKTGNYHLASNAI